jgi:hypothetical protein
VILISSFVSKSFRKFNITCRKGTSISSYQASIGTICKLLIKVDGGKKGVRGEAACPCLRLVVDSQNNFSHSNSLESLYLQTIQSSISGI